MRSPYTRVLAALLASLLLHGGALAAGRDEAQQFVAKAVAYLKQQGKDKALDAFNDPAGEFVAGELYIVVLDMNGVLLADGAKPRLKGTALRDIKDVNGKYFVREEIDLAKKQGKGWVDFEWFNPVSKKMEPRSTYLERVDDLIVLSGVYRQK